MLGSSKGFVVLLALVLAGIVALLEIVRPVDGLTVDQLPLCLYQANLFGQTCCMPGQNCPGNWCKCPAGWTCDRNKCIAPCSSFLLQTNSGNPRDSFTFCEQRSAGMRGMPSCFCPVSPIRGLRAVCTADRHNKIDRKMCTYQRRRRRGGRRLLLDASAEGIISDADHEGESA